MGAGSEKEEVGLGSEVVEGWDLEAMEEAVRRDEVGERQMMRGGPAASHAVVELAPIRAGVGDAAGGGGQGGGKTRKEAMLQQAAEAEAQEGGKEEAMKDVPLR